MSGKGQASGSDYEADAFAYISAHVLSGRALPWFSDRNDVPVAIRTQTGTAGDDFVVELREGGEIEVQAKHGASGHDFIIAAARLLEGLQRDPKARGVLLVDTSSSGTIRVDFQEDAQRFADGIAVAPRPVMKKVVDNLRVGVETMSDAFKRFRLIVSDFPPGSDAAALAQHLLGGAVEDPARGGDAWELLGREALRVAKRAGRQDAPALADILKPLGLKVRIKTQSRETYLDWAIETNAAFVLAPLPDIRVDSLVAWDGLLPRTIDDRLPVADADAISHYHAWFQQSDSASARDTFDRCKLLEDGNSAVILGGAGAGKSTLTQSLAREACEGGFLAVRVALKQIALAMAEGKSFDEALEEFGFQGSGLDKVTRQDLLSQADFLIADGLDETEPSRVAVAANLLAWLKGHPRAKIIVTSRPVGHSNALLPGFRRFDLSALTPGGASRLAYEIFQAAFGDAERAADALDRFETETASNRAAILAARNPLLLSCMVALSVEGKALPTDVPALFDEVIDLLRRTRPHERLMTTEDVDSSLAAIVVEEAGWHLVETASLTRDALVAAVAARLERDGFGNRFDSRRAAHNTLLFWEEHRLLERLRIGTREYLTFVHLNLGEHAAARRVRILPDTEVASWLGRVCRDAKWREVILLSAAAGMGERLAATLLDLGDSCGGDSSEVYLAAACAEEVTAPAVSLAERIVVEIGKRLGRRDELAAAEVLARLARFVPGTVSRICIPLLQSSSPATRLSAEAGVFAGDQSLVPAGLPLRWLDDYVPVQLFQFGRRAPERRSPLPIEAKTLQERTLILAIDSLFQTAPREEAEDSLRKCLPSVSTHLLDDVHSVLVRHRAAHLVEDRMTRDRDRMMESLRAFNADDHRAELIAVLEAIAAAVGRPAGSEQDSSHTLPLISRVLSALNFWELGGHGLGRGDDQESLQLIVSRVLCGMRIDRDALRRELANGYRIANNLALRGIYPHIRQVAVRLDWRAAAAERIASDRLYRALVHRASIVVWSAAELLAHGVAGDQSRDVISAAVGNGGRFTCFLLTQVAPEVLGVETAGEVLRTHLHSGNGRYRPLCGIFHGIRVSVSRWGNTLYDEVVLALKYPNSSVAEAAAQALESMKSVCKPEHVSALRDAWQFWTTHGVWCESCEVEVVGRICKSCRAGIRSPRVVLMRELLRCGGLTSEELQSLALDADPDIKREAQRASSAAGVSPTA